jgi:Raf kinase inhibitor-like YbhB/YbcL family protein
VLKSPQKSRKSHNIKAGTDHLGEGIAPANAYRETHNDFGNLGYGGPCPPSGQGVHHYHFRLLALDIAELNLPEHVPVESVEKAVQPHILSTAEIVALYGR